MKEVSKTIARRYNIVVIGGGIAGICAALAAARLGSKVALIHDRPVLGGASSSESHIPPAGVMAHRMSGYSPCWFHYARETGIVEELALENGFRNPGSSWSLWDMVLWGKVSVEPNITLYLNTSAMKSKMKDNSTIAGVYAWQSTTFKEFLIEGDIFIDASGDGHIAYDAGAEYRMGRESKDEFGESLAPEKADTYMMGLSIYMQWKDVGRPVPFTPPKWAKALNDADLLPMKTSQRGAIPGNRFHDIAHLRTQGQGFGEGLSWLEYGGMRNTIEDTEEIRDELLKLAYGLWNKIKNYGEGAENLELTRVGTFLAERESRRFIGDYMLTQNDIQSPTLFPDRIAYGGLPIDLHTPGNIYSRYAWAELVPINSLYSIPFRCLYSKNIKNLLMAGRNISVTHVALGSTRVQKTTGIMGQAAGTGAHLCIKYNTIPRIICEKYIMELQQLLLKHDAFILGLKNDDPGDLARTATVVASSTQRLDVMPSEEEYELNISELDSPRGQMFLITEPKIESIDLLLESRIENDVELQLGLRSARSIYDFSSEEDIATISSVILGTGSPQPVNQQPPIAPVKRTCVTFKLEKELEPGYYWIWLGKMPDIYWCGVSREPIATRRVNMVNGEWRPIKEWGTYCFRLTPPSTPYKAENVVNGVTHPTDGPNIWISESGLPQYVELDFGRPEQIDTVYLTFDSNLDKERGPRPSFLGTPPPELVRDYTLYCDLDGSWVKLVEEKGNYQRHRKHSFDPVTTRKIRLEVQATNGIPQARIYEIRCYGEEKSLHLNKGDN